jgi:hypothetical protein
LEYVVDGILSGTSSLYDDNYKGMIGDDGKILFSKNTLRKLMPKHIKKAGD